MKKRFLFHELFCSRKGQDESGGVGWLMILTMIIGAGLLIWIAVKIIAGTWKL